MYQSNSSAYDACGASKAAAGGGGGCQPDGLNYYYTITTYSDGTFTVHTSWPHGTDTQGYYFGYSETGGCPVNSYSDVDGMCMCASGQSATRTGCNGDGTADNDGNPDTVDTDGDGVDDGPSTSDPIEDTGEQTAGELGDPIPQSGTGSGGETSSGRGGTDDMGNPLGDHWDNQDLFDQDPDNTNYGEMAEEKVNINGQDYQLCWHGGIVSSVANCDYTPPACNSSQIATYYGCLNIDNSNPNPNPDPNPDPTPNPDPEPDQEPGSESEPGTASSSSNCSSPPVCAGGDPQICSLLRQQWEAMCYDNGESEGQEFNEGMARESGNCNSPPVCTGDDPQQCAVLRQLWETQCFGDFTSPETTADTSTQVEALTLQYQDTLESIKTDINSLFNVSVSSAGGCEEATFEVFGVSMDASPCRFLPAFAIIGPVVLAFASFFAVQIITTNRG